MATRRTTLAADPDDLAVLEAEARRRGLSLAALLRETVAATASELRASTRPHFGVARSDFGAARAAATNEHEPLTKRHLT